MPVQDCESEGQPGYRWGEQGACYTYEAGNDDARETARGKAEAQGRAVKARQGGNMAELQEEPIDLPPLPRWRMLAVDESRPTDDGRAFRGEGALTWREPPFALTWTAAITDGHTGAKLGGTVETAGRQGPQVMLSGTFTGDGAGMELLEHVRAGHPLFPSISIGDEIAVWEIDEQGRELLVYDQGKIVGVTLTPEQAQEGTFIELEEPIGTVAACAGPPLPPRAWFDDPGLAEPTSLVVTDEGRVFGHVAGPGCHIGILDRCVKVGATSKDFTLFHKGVQGDGGGLKTAEGTRVRAGQITLVGGHADLHLTAAAARSHYDDTRSAVADVVVGWDERNDLPYFTGALRSGVTEIQVQALRASGVSGDWRPITNELVLVALPAVNVPGFPVRMRALVAGGEMQAFVGRIEEDDMDEQRFAQLHAEAHRAELAQNDPRAQAFAAFQAGNVQALVDYFCTEAGIPWGEEGARTACMEIAEGHVDDPAALCQWMMGQCGASPGAMIADAGLAQMALEGLDRQVWEPELAALDRRAGL